MNLRRFLFCAFAASAPLLAENWPHFQGPSRDGTSEEVGLLKSFPDSEPNTLWETKLEGGFGGAAVVGDEVFLLDRVHQETDILLCLDFATGKEKWRFEHNMEGEPSHPGSRNVPTVTDEAVYFTATFGDVFCIDRKTHLPRWHVRLDERYPDATTPRWGYAQAALIINDLVIVTPFGTETGIAALDIKTGKEIWKNGPIGESHSSPTLLDFGGEPQIILMSRNEDKGLTTSYNPKDGKTLWQTDLYYNKWAIPAVTKVSEDKLFVTGGYDAGSKMLSIKKKNSGYHLKEIWSGKKGSQIHPPILIDNHLYFLANENTNHRGVKRSLGGLSCWTLDGKELWNTGTEPYMGRGSMLYADGALYIQDGQNGILRIVEPDPKGFKLLAEANVFGSDPESKKDLKYWSPLALSQGKLLMRGQDRLLCIDLKK